MSTYFLRTERLGFRPWTEADVDLAMTLWGDPAVTRFIGGPFSRQWVLERLARETAHWRAHGFQYWPIFLLAGGEHVGCCGLKPRKPEEGILEIGFHLRPPFWGFGYAPEAARAVMRYAFHALGARALFAGHGPANDASRRVLQKLGFRHTHAELYPPTGLNHPAYLLTLEEFRSIDPR